MNDVPDGKRAVRRRMPWYIAGAIVMAALLAVAGIVALAGPLVGAKAENGVPVTYEGYGWENVVLYVAMVLLGPPVACGLWKARRWARFTAMVVLACFLAFSAVEETRSSCCDSWIDGAVAALGFCFIVWIFYFRREAREYFGAARRTESVR